MSRSLRIVLGISVILLVIFGAVIVLGMRLVKKSLPQLRGEHKLSVLSQPVTVYRDQYGVPHIFAQNEEDLWRTAGYITAQDRLWQMDLTRRAVRGTLSEVFGEVTLPDDKFLRVWGFHRIARRIAENLSPPSRQMLQAYAEGVNAFIAENHQRLPLEFSILRYKPEPWRIEDSIGYIRLMGFKLNFAWFFEPVLGKVADKYGLPMALEIFPAVLENTPSIIPEMPRRFASSLDDFLQLAIHTRSRLGLPVAGLGSNSWAVRGARTTTGKPILANDPHLGLTLPSIWYEMHLVAGAPGKETIDVAGVTFPGLPGVVLGHNRVIAWGFTNGMVDDLDFYLEKINPASPDEYWTGSGWKKMEVLEEYIPIKGRDPELFKIYLTVHGPVVNSISDVVRNDSLAVSFRWTGFEPTEDVAALSLLNRAKSWEDFQQAMQHYAVPNQNVIYADTAGNIGYYSCGRVPIRRDGKGYLPYRGWENAGDWIGMIPFEQMPHVYNPVQNYVATANNLIVGKNYPYYLSNAWEPSSRIERITELITNLNPSSVQSVVKMQNDVVSMHARRMLPVLLNLLDRATSDSSNASTRSSEEENNARLLISNWDGIETPDSVPAVLFEIWSYEFLLATMKDELGDTLFKSYAAWSTLAIRALEYLAQHPESSWFDNRNTPEVETAPEIALVSYRRALQFLRERLGDILGDWQWGKIHQLTLAHPLGKQRPLDQIFNADPFPCGGSAATINKGEYLLSDPFAVSVGPSVRIIVDLAHPDAAWFVIPGGQSGQPFSEHYKDQIELWRQGKYRKVSMRRDEVAATSKNTLILQPATQVH
ncbi:MAG: penicillin acylase family protein [candidate division KSB1 bacterium]|nr:penicillin acylase family protein [candidate division KSB1 bacterium]MDZ7313776.1 penicillin acylase family protein [candidate division KSB1 bacterium]